MLTDEDTATLSRIAVALEGIGESLSKIVEVFGPETSGGYKFTFTKKEFSDVKRWADSQKWVREVQKKTSTK